MMRAGNPAMSAFQKPVAYSELSPTQDQPKTMTLQGTVNATAIMLGACASAALASVKFVPSHLIMPVAFGGAILGFILSLVIIFKPTTAPKLGLVYAVLEGVFLGGISLFYENWAGAQAAAADGGGVVANIGNSIVLQAVILTFGIAGAMLLAYSTRVIRVTPMFTKVVVTIMVGYLFASLGTMLLRFFGVGIPYLHQMGPLGIAIAGFVVVLAAVTLLLDFNLIEQGIKSGQPRYMEWYGAFALMVTLVWLYLRILYLLSLLRRSD
jgi:uncharacterized YccA/Bax inhibitor family protein